MTRIRKGKTDVEDDDDAFNDSENRKINRIDPRLAVAPEFNQFHVSLYPPLRRHKESSLKLNSLG